ncbi:hypothetical protein SMJ63A_110103 [Stenotrophomonas geniculata]
MALTAGIPTLGANNAKPSKTVAAQSLAGLTPCATMPKASGLAIVGSAVFLAFGYCTGISWRATGKGWRGVRKPVQ